MSLGVHSEVGRLQKVLVHQPGWEHRRMIPWNREAMLCDDILDIDMARPEHKDFVQRMQQAGVEVLYFLDLLKDVCADPKQHAEVVQAVTPGGLPPHVAPTDIQPTHLVIGYPEHYRFGEKVLLGTDGSCEFGTENFDGDLPLVFQILSEIDYRHAATTDLPLDGVAGGQSRREAREGVVHIVFTHQTPRVSAAPRR